MTDEPHDADVDGDITPLHQGSCDDTADGKMEPGVTDGPVDVAVNCDITPPYHGFRDLWKDRGGGHDPDSA